MHRHTIPSFVLSKPFWLQQGSRVTPHASHPEMEVRRCPRRNQRRATRAAWVRSSFPLPDVILERANSLAVVEGVLSRLFPVTAAASTIGHVCQARSEAQAEKGQWVPCKSPGERELGIVQEARTWHPIPLGTDLHRRPAVPLTERVRSPSPPLVPDTILSEAVKGHWTQKSYEGLYGIRIKTVLRLSAYVLRPFGLT